MGCPADPQEVPQDPRGGLWETETPSPRALDEHLAPFPLLSWTDWPVENVSPVGWFGWRLEPSGQYTHASGLRLAVGSDSYVIAIADGFVRETSRRQDGSFDVKLAHGDGTESRYHRLKAALVYAGMPVIRGTVLGLAESAEMTLEVWIGDTELDPLLVLRSPLQFRRLPPP